jgi:hypothetical protein
MTAAKNEKPDLDHIEGDRSQIQQATPTVRDIFLKLVAGNPRWREAPRSDKGTLLVGQSADENDFKRVLQLVAHRAGSNGLRLIARTASATARATLPSPTSSHKLVSARAQSAAVGTDKVRRLIATSNLCADSMSGGPAQFNIGPTIQT